MPPSYSIHLFGKPTVSNEAGEAVSGLGLGKPLALLAYLIVQGETARDEVIGLLWGDIPELKARNAFRQALHRLRSALGEDVIPHDPDVLSVVGTISEASDVRRFERLLEANKLESAIETYTGDFLSGLDVGESAFDRWRDGMRENYKAKFRDALRAVIQSDIDAGEIARALRRAATLASSDRGDSEAAILHASTLLGAGRRTEAQQVLEDFERLYRDDFESPAPPQVREFLTRLRRVRDVAPGAGAARQQQSFVGRERELSILLTRMRSLENAGGSVVIVGGEAGAGKTRLIEEFLLRARDLGSALFLQGRERSPDAGIAYASVGEALRGLLEAPGIAGTGQHLLAEAARLLPQLRDKFSLPPITDISDDAGRLRFYEGVAALLDSVAYEQPVCIALDDFHNCSRTTYGLVEYLAERLSASPVFFIIAGRSTPSFVAQGEMLLRSLSKSRTPAADRAGSYLQLGPLDRDSARSLAAELQDTASDFSADDIVAMTDAIPFRIIEACERIRAGVGGTSAPVTMKEVLWARLQRGSQAEQRLFVTVALFDRPVSIRLLAAASHLPEKSALAATLSLEREGLVRQRPEGVEPAHDFSGELALDGTGPAGRALLASWAAEALERDGSATAAEVARLFALAGRRAEAFSYSRRAAFEAMSAGAADETVRHFNTALATASTREEREDIEKLLRSLGDGRRLLAGETGRMKEETESPPRESNIVERGPEAATPAAAQEKRKSWTRQNLGAAIPALAALAAILFLGLRFFTSTSRIPGTSLADSLVVARELDPRDTVFAFATGSLGSPLHSLEGATRHGLTRTWIDSLRLPWANPLPSPDGRSVAVERITKSGSELYVMSMDRRDTVQLRSGEGDDFSNAWSPDGRWLLATHGETRSDGTYDAELFGYSIMRDGRRVAFDTARSESVVEAEWSPDGSHVAWTARIGPQHQQDVFVSDANGENVEDISNTPAEEYSIAWSPDGATLAFTSERTGRAELYAEDIKTHVLRQLTWEGAHADHAAFSPDGRWLAYESTRGGHSTVYVMPSAGGTGRRVTTQSERISLVGWLGHRIPYIDQIFVDAPSLPSPGDTGVLAVRALDRQGNRIKSAAVRLEVIDRNLIRFAGAQGGGGDSVPVIALGRGLARISASAGGWRADTAYVPIGEDALPLIEDDFEKGMRRDIWRPIGDPLPATAQKTGAGGSTGLVARSDREWESGLLSRSVFPVRRGVSAGVWVSAPFSGPAAARSFVVALVAADPAEVVDSEAPHFLRLASVSWIGEAGRISYSVGRENFTEPLAKLAAGNAHRIEISIAGDDAVAFSVDGVMRWKSSLRLVTTGENSRAQLWLGSQGAGNFVVFDDVVLRLQPGTSRKTN